MLTRRFNVIHSSPAWLAAHGYRKLGTCKDRAEFERIDWKTDSSRLCACPIPGDGYSIWELLPVEQTAVE
jgi:hypothetical protein